MNIINAEDLGFKELNDRIREGDNECRIENCLGQRFIAAGMSGKNIIIDGTPGNALGTYLGGSFIVVNGNAQDAVGDTMNDGTIVVHGNIGDAVGYAMRGGAIYIKNNAGFRAGIHMKEYKEKRPVIVVGGRAGSFLGEYQAGGLIIVLGLNEDNMPVIGDFPCTGMHGGKMIIRGKTDNLRFPKYVTVREADKNDMDEIQQYIDNFCYYFGYNPQELGKDNYTVIIPDSKNPYKQMYIAN